LPLLKLQRSYVQRNNEERSCKYCCCGKAISITNYECVSLALAVHHAKRMRHIVCGRGRLLRIFPDYLTNGTI